MYHLDTSQKSRRFFQSAGLSNVKKEEMLDYVQEQLQSMVADATSTSKHQGRANYDRKSFVEALVIAITDSGLLVNDNDEGTEPMKKFLLTSAKIKLLGLARTTGYHLFKKQAKKKKDILEGTHIDGWVGVTSRDRFMQKVPNNVREKVVK